MKNQTRTVLAVIAISAVASAQSPLNGNINNPQWGSAPAGTPNNVAVISVAFTDKPHLLSEQEQVDAADDLEQLASNNSYGNYELHVFPEDMGDDALPYRITVPRNLSWYTTPGNLAPENRVIQVLIDAREQFKRHNQALGTGLTWESFENVVYYINTGQSFGSCTSPAPFQQFSAGSQGPYVMMTHKNALAAGILHEMGHTYSAAHATTWWTTILSGNNHHLKGDMVVVPYGDPFDYMGLGGCCAPRLTEPNYAPETAIHAAPNRKLQNGWMTASNVQKVTGSGSWTINGITTGTGLMALEIPRGAQGGTSESLWVFYRDNEPLADGGASIVFGSRETRGGTRQLSFFQSESLPGSPCTSSEPIPGGLGPVLVPGKSFYDSISGKLISVVSANASTKQLSVSVSNVLSPGPNNLHVPVVNIVCSEIEQRVPLGNQSFDVFVEAYDADIEGVPPARWLGIQQVTVTCPTTPEASAQTESGPNLLGGSQTFDANDLAALNGAMLPITLNLDNQFINGLATTQGLSQTGPWERVASFVITATSNNGRVNVGKVNFVLDTGGTTLP